MRNAWQHCQKKEGSIRIAARAGYMGDAVIFELDDDGPGIPAELRGQIFEPFFTTRPGGTGLGLYIARELADANGATLELLPEGARRAFPDDPQACLAGPAPAHAGGAARRPEHRRRRRNPMSRSIRAQPKVLVVDDEPDLLELLELTLSRMGLDTERAATVAEAIALLDRESFDLCLTDMRLPDGEGLRVVEHINQQRPRRAGGRDHRASAAPRTPSRRSRPAPSTTSRSRSRSSSCARWSSRRSRCRTSRRADGRGEPAARRVAGDAARARADRAARQEPGAGVRQRRVGQRQGARRADDPQRRAARDAAVHRGQLRRDPREPDGERVLRLPEGRVHRRRGRPRRLLPGGERRHAVPRRGRRPAARRCRSSCCARSRRRRCARSARPRRSRSTCASSARRTRSWPRWSRPASSARTCSTGCT